VDFQTFIRLLFKSSDFTEAEKNSIHILPLLPGESFMPQHIFSSRRLSAWYELINSKDLLHIISKRSIKTFFQPLFLAKDLELFGFEALSRGVAEDGTIIPPVELFKKAKILDLQFALDRLTREKAIENAKSNGLGDYMIFINFMPDAIYNPKECLSTTIITSKKVEFRPERLIFEVIESEQVKDIQHLKSILDYYRSKGFKTALDDFGSGYSSLKMLEILTPDFVKIDMHFVRGIHQDSFKKSIVKTVISLCRDKDIKTIAEGIESYEEYETIVDLEVDFVQGYLFAKPAPDVNLDSLRDVKSRIKS